MQIYDQIKHIKYLSQRVHKKQNIQKILIAIYFIKCCNKIIQLN